jgi:hypothetical protein
MNAGDLVICGCTFEKYQEMFDFEVNTPTPLKIYTIRQVVTLGTFKGLLLEEIYNRKVDTLEFGPMELQFDSTCFDLVPQADIDELKQLL